MRPDGSVMFVIETAPYLDDQRTEVYDAEGDVLGSILWNGTQPSHICVYSESASHSQPFEMVPRGDPTSQDQFEVIAGDGAHEILWVVDRRGLRAHYPMHSRGSSHRPPLVADYIPLRASGAAKMLKGSTATGQRKFSETDCDVLELAVEQMSDDALGRFWVAFILLDIIHKSKFALTAPALATPPSAKVARRVPKTASGRSGWGARTEKLKDLTIGMMLQPRRWSL